MSNSDTLGAIGAGLKPESSKRVLVFHPNPKQNPFWEAFHITLDEDLRAETLEPMYTFLDYDSDDAADGQKIAKRDFSSAAGAIVAPTGSATLTVAVQKAIEGVKLVIHDLTPNRVERLISKTNIEMPPLVSIENYTGGKLAAQILFGGINHEDKVTEWYDILVIPGNTEHSHSIERVRGFQDEMHVLARGRVAWYYTKDGHWQRETAKHVFKEFYDIATDTTQRWELDGVFACNDFMLLGALDVLEAYPPNPFSNVRFVGFDGIPEVVEKMKYSPQIAGTVDAMVAEQAKSVVKQLRRLIHGDATEESPIIPKKIQNTNYHELT